MTSISVKSPKFYSPEDEENFFAWLEKIAAVVNVRGSGNDLLIEVAKGDISDGDLRELLALFYRHNIEMEVLDIFLNESNKSWFADNMNSYWYNSVFKNRKSITSLDISDRAGHWKHVQETLFDQDYQKSFLDQNIIEGIARALARFVKSDHKMKMWDDIRSVLDENRGTLNQNYYDVDQMFLVVKDRSGNDAMHVVDLLDVKSNRLKHKEF